MNFRFQNLLAAPYRGGNVKVTTDNTLLSPIGNRISATDLTKSQTITLPFQLSSNISRIAVTSNNQFLLAIDSAGRASFINIHTRTVLHRITFKSPVSAVEFSPDGKFIAVGFDRAVQVWSSPGFKKEFFSFHLVRTFHDCGDNVTCIDWSRDSMHLVVGSKDLTVRIYCVDKSKGPSKPFVMMGHRESVVGVYFVYAKGSEEVNGVYSLSKDGAIFTWALVSGEDEGSLNARKWELVKKDFFMQSPARLTACDYHSELDMVVVAFSDGVFGLYQMPDFVCIHKLSISRQKITTAVFNKLGNWLTFGCAKLGQLLVWEWRTESYILKQQGHYFDVNCVSYSPDSQMIATGADDNKIKVWTVSSGFCFVTFSKHTNAVTALHFMANNNCLLSASLDGTVRAWDLFRYRNFRIFTTPTPRQFVALTADQSGEIICAGTLDSFEIYVWSMKTGRLLDILSGHEGPVHGLMFSPTNAILASSSWDKTVRLWDVFEGKGAVESFPHTHDVLTLVYRPDGKQLACSTLDGQIHFWDPIDGVAMYTIEGRRDIAGGRLMTDRRSALNSTSGKYFTTLCYSADGSYILAGGNSKFICMYDIADQVLLRKFQITRNLSLDGVLDFLNGKNMTEAGPLDLIDDEDSDVEDGIDKQTYSSLGYNLPGAKPNRGRPIVRAKCLKIAPTGRSWAAATTEGVLMYSVDDSFVFDPTDLDIDVTPEAVDVALAEDQHQRALLISLRLNEDSLIKKCIFAVNPLDISAVASSIPIKYIQRLVEAFADLLENCPHLEFCLQWCQELCKAHGQFIHQNSRSLLPALKSLQKSMAKMHQDLSDICSSNEYMLKYLCSTGAII